MTDNLLLLGMLTGIVVPIVLFFLQHRGTFEYLVFGVGVLMILVTLAIVMLEQRSEPPQPAFGTDQQPGAAALLLPSTSPETQAPPAPSAAPSGPVSSTTASVPVATRTVAPFLDAPTPGPTEDEAPGAAPEALVGTVRAEVANVRRDPAPVSPIVGTVARSDELIVIGTEEGWYQVRLGERHAPQSALRGGQGWIWGELVNTP